MKKEKKITTKDWGAVRLEWEESGGYYLQKWVSDAWKSGNTGSQKEVESWVKGRRGEHFYCTKRKGVFNYWAGVNIGNGILAKVHMEGSWIDAWMMGFWSRKWNNEREKSWMESQWKKIFIRCKKEGMNCLELKHCDKTLECEAFDQIEKKQQLEDADTSKDGKFEKKWIKTWPEVTSIGKDGWVMGYLVEQWRNNKSEEAFELLMQRIKWHWMAIEILLDDKGGEELEQLKNKMYQEYMDRIQCVDALSGWIFWKKNEIKEDSRWQECWRGSGVGGDWVFDKEVVEGDQMELKLRFWFEGLKRRKEMGLNINWGELKEKILKTKVEVKGLRSKEILAEWYERVGQIQVLEYYENKESCDWNEIHESKFTLLPREFEVWKEQWVHWVGEEATDELDAWKKRWAKRWEEGAACSEDQKKQWEMWAREIKGGSMNQFLGWILTEYSPEEWEQRWGFKIMEEVIHKEGFNNYIILEKDRKGIVIEQKDVKVWRAYYEERAMKSLLRLNIREEDEQKVKRL